MSESPAQKIGLLSTREAAAYLRLSASTLEKLRVSGKGPVYVQPARKVSYTLHDLDAWIAGNRRTSTSAARERDRG